MIMQVNVNAKWFLSKMERFYKSEAIEWIKHHSYSYTPCTLRIYYGKPNHIQTYIE